MGFAKPKRNYVVHLVASHVGPQSTPTFVISIAAIAEQNICLKTCFQIADINQRSKKHSLFGSFNRIEKCVIFCLWLDLVGITRNQYITCNFFHKHVIILW